jgi:hypothetical protein
MSQDLGSTPAAPHAGAATGAATDSHALAAARAVQHLLHGCVNAADVPTLSDIPVLPASAAVVAPPAAQAPRHRALCSCCGGAWETDVDLRQHPDEMLLCPRCAAVIRSQTEGLDDIERPLPQAMAMAAAMAMAPRPPAAQAVNLDNLPPRDPRPPLDPGPEQSGAEPTASLPPAFALLAQAAAELQASAPQAGTARPRNALAPWALGGAGVLLLALGAFAGYEWNEARTLAHAVAARVAQAEARPMARPMGVATTSTSGTAQVTDRPAAATPRPQPPSAAPSPRAVPQGCPQGVAAMGLCDAS